jgi:hypothetical protein
MSLQHVSRRGWRLAALLAVVACVRKHDGSGPKDPHRAQGPKYEAQAWLRLCRVVMMEAVMFESTKTTFYVIAVYFGVSTSRGPAMRCRRR